MNIMNFLPVCALLVLISSTHAVKPAARFKQLRGTLSAGNTHGHEIDSASMNPTPKTVTQEFVTALETKNLRITKRLGGGSFGEAFRCHIKKAYRPNAKFYGKVDKEHFAIKFVKNRADELTA